MALTVQQIKKLIDNASDEEFEALEQSLVADSRKGVIAALTARKKRDAALECERTRVQSLYDFDASFSEDGNASLVGLDEVGRGAVAGPLAVGAVVLPREPIILGLNDSKKLSAEKRVELAERIREVALSWSVYFIEPQEIDRQGMSLSLRNAFKGALNEVLDDIPCVSTVLIDGNPLGIDKRERNVVKGDAKSASIAAASIIAKVTRDDFMRNLDASFPSYGFFHNKGYASQDHIDAIRREGLTSVHRESFCRSFLQQTLF